MHSHRQVSIKNITNRKMECVGMKVRIGCRRNAINAGDSTIQIPVQLRCGNASPVTKRDIRESQAKKGSRNIRRSTTRKGERGTSKLPL